MDTPHKCRCRCEHNPRIKDSQDIRMVEDICASSHIISQCRVNLGRCKSLGIKDNPLAIAKNKPLNIGLN